MTASQFAGHLCTQPEFPDVRIQTIEKALAGLESTDEGTVIVSPLVGPSGLAEVAQQVLADCTTPLPLVAVCQAERKDISAGLDAGLDLVMVKPIDFDHLAAQLRAVRRSHARLIDAGGQSAAPARAESPPNGAPAKPPAAPTAARPAKGAAPAEGAEPKPQSKKPESGTAEEETYLFDDEPQGDEPQGDKSQGDKAAVGPETGQGEAEPEPPVSSSDADRIAASPGWQGFGDRIAEIIAATYNLQNLRRRPVPELADESATTVTMLHDPEMELLITIGVTMKDKHLSQLRPLLHVQQMIDYELFYDVAGELTNVLAGKLKAGLSSQGFKPSQVLPRPASTRELRERIGRAPHEWALLLHNMDLSIIVTVILEPFAGECVPPRRMKPTGKLPRDVLTDRGVLLVAAGANVTEAAISRLKAAVPNQTFAIRT